MKVSDKVGRATPEHGNATGVNPWLFTRNFSGSVDSRLTHYVKHFAIAKRRCRIGSDWPRAAARQLGTALHPAQDWVAHADYARKSKGIGGVWLVHNSNSPQTTYGDPGGYPDDPFLDVVGSPDGRASQGFIVDKLVKTYRIYDPYGHGYRTEKRIYNDFAYYEPGRKRYELTKLRTEASLTKFREWVRQYGGCRCKRYFGITP